MTSRGEALSPLATEVYRACLVLGPRTLCELSREFSWADHELRRAVTRLVDLGLLVEQVDTALSQQDPGDPAYRAQAPGAPLGRIAAEHHRESAKALELAASLSQLWHEHRDPAPYVEFLTADAEVAAAGEALLDDAREEVVALSIGPVGPTPGRPPIQVSEGFVRARGRGVAFRVVYGASILRDPAGLAAVQASIELGEQARVSPDVPFNLRVADRCRATVTIPGSGDQRRHAILIHPSGLLDAMMGLFASYWRSATPLPGAGEMPAPDPQSRQLLAHLAAGLTDESIARELGVSERTVGRRIARLQEQLGAATRFQLGLRAGRLGWLEDQPADVADQPARGEAGE